MMYRFVFLFAKCLRRSSRVTSLKQTDFSRHGTPQCLSFVPVCSVQTGNPTSEQLVYKGELQNNIKRLKILTLSTSIGGLCIQPSVLSKLWETNPYLTCSVGIISTVFIVTTPLLVHLFTRRYVTELYFNPETKIFTATTLTIFIRKRKITFTADDVYVPAIPGFFTTFLVRKIPMFVDSDSVIDVEAYQHLLGYDKPIDFHFQKFTGEKKTTS